MTVARLTPTVYIKETTTILPSLSLLLPENPDYFKFFPEDVPTCVTSDPYLSVLKT